MHTAIRVVAIPTEVAEFVRRSVKAPGYGHPAHNDLASGYGPCRHRLRMFELGQERRISFTYNPFMPRLMCRCPARSTFMRTRVTDMRMTLAITTNCDAMLASSARPEPARHR